MNIIKTVLGVALLSTIIAPGVRADEDKRSHEMLITSIRSVGVTVSINDPICEERAANGMYVSRNKLLIVCQDNAKWSGDEVRWTANDYDTLRHEAHHVLQDCMNGELGDGLLADFFNEPDEYNEFITDTIGSKRARVIAEVYELNGASESIILNEIEAFAVAQSVSPGTIGDVVERVCGNK